MKRGQWHLQIIGVNELNETDKEHIAECVKEGFTSGEIIQSDEDIHPTLGRIESAITGEDYEDQTMLAISILG